MALFVLLCLLALVAASLVYLLLRSKKSKESVAAAIKAPRVSVDAGHSDTARVAILYGTQTGTAERFSKQLGNEIRSKYASILVDVRDVENYPAQQKLQKEKLVVFAMATYGDGEPTDNAAEFYSWLCKEADAVEGGDKEPYLQVGCFQQVGVAVSYV